ADASAGAEGHGFAPDVGARDRGHRARRSQGRITMTSNATKLARRAKYRANRLKIKLAGGQTAKAVIPGVGAQPKEPDASIPAIIRRLRENGLPDTDANRATVKQAMAGDPVGQAIMRFTGSPQERQDLWGSATHLRRVWAAYRAAIGAPRAHPKGGTPTPVDAMETSANAPAHDLRSDEEKSRAAVSAYMACQGWLDYCDRQARAACLVAVIDEAGLPDERGIILALQCVGDGMAGRKIVWRGRNATTG
ncbi:MAG: hypothetical protein EBR73_17385, partial [Rhodobacteraceae bacterium]|nr:hypothetical protein [Paracoccaceae bacterium]